MTLVPVEKLPKRNTRCSEKQVIQKPIQAYLAEFMKMDSKYVKVLYTSSDYANVDSAVMALRSGVKVSGFPISVIRRYDNVYLIRKDLEDPDEQL